MQTRTCLTLMFKAPDRSKQRLAAEIGARAQTLAQHLFDCAVADLEAWPGPTCLAPAAAADLTFVEQLGYRADTCTAQGSGNLGERIARVNAALQAVGYTQQLFIGIDCPALDPDYLARADAALDKADVVLGPADDGGVVLMGVRGLWPALADLPWSTAALQTALIDACEHAGLRVTLLEAHGDVDRASDLQALPERLRADPRPSRRRLCAWIEAESLTC